MIFQSIYHSFSPIQTSFQSLCPSRRTLVYLNGENGYEYKPDHYEEVTCQHPFTSFRDYRVHRNKVIELTRDTP